MSYIYMKILELIPEEYDRGIKRFAATDFEALREEIASLVEPGERLLDVGCGPGTLALLAAGRGARVTGWDRNADMVTFATGKAVELELADDVKFEVRDAPAAPLEPEAYDAVVMSLALSEMRGAEQLATLEGAWQMLKPGGRLVVVDEVPPRRPLRRVWYYFKRFWLKLVVYVVARAVTRPLQDLPAAVAARGFTVTEERYLEGGKLLYLVATNRAARPAPETREVSTALTLGDRLADAAAYLSLYMTFLRVEPGLYRVGSPGPASPLFVTANFTLTFNLVRRALRGLDAYLLVIDTRGINVWCAAGGGKFSTREVALSHRAFRLAEVAHRTPAVLPQLAATGVAAHKLRDEFGLAAAYGPVYARDVPAYVAGGYRKTPAMRRADWGLAKRLEVTWFFALMNAAAVALPLAVFHKLYSPLAVAAVAAISLAVGALFPWLPTRLYSVKGLATGAVVAIPLMLYKWWGGAGGRSLATWAVFLAFAGVLLGLEFSGNTSVASPSQVRQEFKPGIAALAALAVAFTLLVVL
ncbi:MAG TPA: corrinoid protein-associated methyltransferase CpaM [bacterium]|nr:corrinoid protein-associated methyltransferase CpaM [bacterium]